MQLTAVLSLLSRPVSRKEGHDRGMLGQMWGACLQTHKPAKMLVRLAGSISDS